MAMDRLKKRAEFLAVAKGARSARRGFVLQALTGLGDERPPRVGFTVTKKAGNAPERNRIRRRLREAIRLEGARHARPGTDYVVVGRREALALSFAELTADLAGAFRAVHRERRPEKRPDGKPPETGRRDGAGLPASDDTSPGGTR